MGGGRHLLGLSPLQPAVDQGHGEEHQTAHEGRDPSQGEGHCVVPKVIAEETWARKEALKRVIVGVNTGLCWSVTFKVDTVTTDTKED